MMFEVLFPFFFFLRGGVTKEKRKRDQTVVANRV